MLESIKKRIFPFIIALSALAVSGSAAFYSVTGLSKLFAGASLEVIIMASSLEISKLVIASLLYQYWDEINKVLRTYLTIAAGVLILITSMGIYGFLSNAYVQTANLASGADAQIALLESKKSNLIEQRTILTSEKEENLKNISDLRLGLTNNVQTTKDRRGNILTSSSSANRTTFERQLDKALLRQETVNSKIDGINTEILTLENQILETKTNNEASSELGPLKYLSGLTGVPMDIIINYLLLIIIFVFDPLAIALVIAANFAFKQIQDNNEIFPLQNEEKKYKIYNELKPPQLQEEKTIPSNDPEIISDPIEDFDDSSITIVDEEKISSDELFPRSFSTWKRKKVNKIKQTNTLPSSSINRNDDDYIIKY